MNTARANKPTKKAPDRATGRSRCRPGHINRGGSLSGQGGDNFGRKVVSLAGPGIRASRQRRERCRSRSHPQVTALRFGRNGGKRHGFRAILNNRHEHDGPWKRRPGWRDHGTADLRPPQMPRAKSLGWLRPGRGGVASRDAD
jgi:hypothetical protein